MHRPPSKLTAVVQGDAAWRRTPFCDGHAQRRYHLRTVHRTIGFQPDTFSRELIDHGQDAYRTAVCELVAHKIGGPAVVGPYRIALRHSLASCDLFSLHTVDFQIFLVVEPVNAFGVDLSAFPPQQDRQPSITIANVRRSQLAQTPSQALLFFLSALVQQRAPRQFYQPRSATRADPVCRLRPPRQSASLARFQSFFETIYTWRSRYGGLEVNEAQGLKALDDENRRLKTLVADLSLDKEVLKAVIRKNGWPSAGSQTVFVRP